MNAGAATTARDRGPLFTWGDIGAALVAGLHAEGSTIDPCENDYEFALKYDLKIDRRPMTGGGGFGGDFKHWVQPYQDNARHQVYMAAAQTGKTARIFVRLARAAFGVVWGHQIGCYYPTADLPRDFSNTRFRPFLRSNPYLGKFLGAPIAAGDGTKTKGKDATEAMNLGDTHLHFFTIGGTLATEGLPLKMTLFDEVRKMNVSDMERAAFRRQSYAGDDFDMKVSTAGYPKSDIHKFFLEGDQSWFHTSCKCPDGIVLAERTDDCIEDLSHATPLRLKQVEHEFRHSRDPFFGMRGEQALQFKPAAYVCPSCGTILTDPRNGFWIERNEGAFVHSYQMPGLLSVANPAARVLHMQRNMVDTQEFYNSMRGLPYVDTNKMPVQGEHIDACVNHELDWGEETTDGMRRRRFTNCAMGIDVQAGYGVAVIKKKLPNGKARLVHVEVLRNLTVGGKERVWWHRAGELMERYDVRTCVIDHAPEFTAAKNFADAFTGRAYLADFTLSADAQRFVAWGEELLDDDKQRGDPEMRFRVRIDRTRGLHWSVHEWKNRHVETPPLRALLGDVPVDRDGQPVFSAHLKAGRMSRYPVALILRDHLTRFVFRDVVADDPKQALAMRQGKKRWVAEFIGSSPDLAFADLYCSVALARGLPMFDVPSGPH